ncbi:MAG TPA: SIS domain-containing protein [Acetobacteraceae bacterium]|nr:SIS domain-containing protein [Acetobacteraceae bacterium]
MRDEILDTPEAAARCLAQAAAFDDVAARLRALDPSLLVVCARGSSSHAGTFLRYVLARDCGMVAGAAMPSIASVYAKRQRLGGALFLVISQSGRSPDLIRQTEEARAAGAFCLGLLNDTAAPLAAACDAVIDICAGPERSVAATKTVIATIVAGLALAAAWNGNGAVRSALPRLPGRLAQSAALDWSPLVSELRRVHTLFALGRGPGLGIAKEAALKLAETAGIAAIAHSAAEFSHGPMALAGPEFPVLAFIQDDAARPGTEQLVAELAERGVPVFAAAALPPPAAVQRLPTLPPDHPDTDLLTQLLPFYLAAEAAARARGYDPDHPPGLAKVTRTI